MNLASVPLVRGRRLRVLAGVASGLSAHLGVGVAWVRLAFVVLALTWGAGVVLYAWLWAFVPRADDPTIAEDGAAREPRRPATRLEKLSGRLAGVVDRNRGVALATGTGAALIVLLAVFTAGLVGAAVPWQAIAPVATLGLGLALLWSTLNASLFGGPRLTRDRPRRTSALTLVRLIAGVALLTGTVAYLAIIGLNSTSPAVTIVAVFAALAALAVVAAPFVVRYSRGLAHARDGAVRESERARIAAHLHDSVLQTLTLIQKRSSNAAEVARLARGQERDLRSWLYGEPLQPHAMLADALRADAAATEDRYGVVVEVITVGDQAFYPEDAAGHEQQLALLAAAGEAMTNAAQHAGGKISVFAELGGERPELFVRDHGAGFDPEAAPADRHGVRDSIVGRLAAVGGTSSFRRLDAGGMEVRLAVALTPRGAKGASEPAGAAPPGDTAEPAPPQPAGPMARQAAADHATTGSPHALGGAAESRGTPA